MEYSSGFDKIVKEAKSRIKEIDVHGVKKILGSADVVILDVREDNEWASGHLLHAKHLCKGIVERDIEKMIPDYQQKVVVYCGGGGRSALVAENLQRMGYQQILSMAGGIRGWQAEGFPLIKDE